MAGILISLFITKGWNRLIPILIAALFIVSVLGVQHRIYENHVAFDYHQIYTTSSAVDHDRNLDWHYRYKLAHIHDHLQYLRLTTQYQSTKNSRRAKSKYKTELKHYRNEARHYKQLKSKQDANLHEAQHNIHIDKGKLHRLVVKK